MKTKVRYYSSTGPNAMFWKGPLDWNGLPSFAYCSCLDEKTAELVWIQTNTSFPKSDWEGMDARTNEEVIKKICVIKKALVKQLDGNWIVFGDGTKIPFPKKEA